VEPKKDGEIPAPPSDEQFAKNQLQEVLKAFCAAFEALDPNAIKVLWPKTNMDALQRQLKQYKSAQCKFGEPKFLSLDPKIGKAKIEADLKRGYVLAGTSKTETHELIATITLSRPGPRTGWFIDTVDYRPKPPA
jgi:hypothetical protein